MATIIYKLIAVAFQKFLKKRFKDCFFFGIVGTGKVFFANSEKIFIILNNRYFYLFQARDKAPSSNPGTDGSNVNSVYVAITVIDVNDHPPKFEQEVYYVNVKETKPIGEVIIDVTATDEDKGLRLFSRFSYVARPFFAANLKHICKRLFKSEARKI